MSQGQRPCLPDRILEYRRRDGDIYKIIVLFSKLTPKQQKRLEAELDKPENTPDNLDFDIIKAMNCIRRELPENEV